MGWAKFQVFLGGGETRYDIVVIPYHAEAHWNLLVLEPSHTFHFDSKYMTIWHMTSLFDRSMGPC
jgi:hypothetical protein